MRWMGQEEMKSVLLVMIMRGGESCRNRVEEAVACTSFVTKYIYQYPCYLSADLSLDAHAPECELSRQAEGEHHQPASSGRMTPVKERG